ncbi:MAG: endonuclease MutS2 [Clostridia bacterium]|nr:endonuclease MutS2 [Clostridia bacterium]
MNRKILETLEFDKVLDMLALHTRCCISRELAKKLVPFDDPEDIELSLKLTAEAETLLNKLGSSPVDEFTDVRELVARLHDGMALGLSELLAVAGSLRAMRIAKNALKTNNSCELIPQMAQDLPSLSFIEEELHRCILNEDELFDGASPALARIRRELKLTNERVRERLNSMIRSSTFQKYLQDPIVTMRNGRFVLPVKQEYRKNVPGLIHDQSSSGQTLFIEPSGVVELGNAFKKLSAEERDEIERILIALTSMLVPYKQEIIDGICLLGRIDLPFAKASLARDMRAVMPTMNEKGFIRIIRGRHPLLSRESVVPVDIWLGKDFHTLIITGPNTGGKTVTLKTVGLFTIMAQSGLFVPADMGTQLSSFDAVYADIGDEQSIEQSLSTFSSHMTRIVDILKKASNRSLVLLDELGAGTDPIEGAALAMSILETLHKRNTITLATTHYSEIKAFALSHEGMENASMEFDVEKLVPTYRLFIGIPGKSNAFEISKRLGLSNDIIERARKLLKQEDIRFEDVISGAESQRRIAEEERRLAQEARMELDKLRKETEETQRKLEENKRSYQLKAREEAKRMVADTRHEMDKLIAQIRSIKTIDQREADRIIQNTRDELRKKEASIAQQEEVPMDNSLPPKTVNPGDEVRVVSLDKKGTVLSPPDAKGDVQLQIGIIKMSAKLSDLRLEEKPKKTIKTSAQISLKNEPAKLSLDVRGMTVDEASVETDRYLESAAMHGLQEVMIIHGKGTGALRLGIHAFLKQHRLVESFRIGAYGEGDAGVTAVKIKTK